jgi:hypothetical protein
MLINRTFVDFNGYRKRVMFNYQKLHLDVLKSVIRHEINHLCSRQLLNVFLSTGYFHS